VHQARALDSILNRARLALDHAISLTVEPEALIARMLHRAAVEGRADDNEDTIRRRMEVYAGATMPLIFHYESQGILVEIDGTGTIEDVQRRMFAEVDAHAAAL